MHVPNKIKEVVCGCCNENANFWICTGLEESTSDIFGDEIDVNNFEINNLTQVQKFCDIVAKNKTNLDFLYNLWYDATFQCSSLNPCDDESAAKIIFEDGTVIEDVEVNSLIILAIFDFDREIVKEVQKISLMFKNDDTLTEYHKYIDFDYWKEKLSKYNSNSTVHNSGKKELKAIVCEDCKGSNIWFSTSGENFVQKIFGNNKKDTNSILNINNEKDVKKLCNIISKHKNDKDFIKEVLSCSTFECGDCEDECYIDLVFEDGTVINGCPLTLIGLIVCDFDNDIMQELQNLNNKGMISPSLDYWEDKILKYQSTTVSSQSDNATFTKVTSDNCKDFIIKWIADNMKNDPDFSELIKSTSWKRESKKKSGSNVVRIFKNIINDTKIIETDDGTNIISIKIL